MNTPSTVTPLGQLRAALHHQRWLVGLVSLHAALAAVLHLSYQVDDSPRLMVEGFVLSLVMGPLFALCAYALYVMVCVRPRQLIRYLREHVAAYLTLPRVLEALPALLLLPLFSTSFTVIKALVPIVHPYDWDRRLAELDQALHGGVQPWIWLQPLVGHPLVTAALNLAYHLWFFILFAIMYWLILATERRQLRMQFLLSFVLSWTVLGNVVATVLSSAGPCYYHLVVGGANPYAPLMHYLHVVDRHLPILALDVQDMLWRGYHAHLGVSGMTISAMPSMHVASATLLALLGWRLRPAAGVALTGFAILILFGSIHLGWHYAIDGYTGAAGAILIWLLVGWLQQRHTPAAGGSAP